MEQTGKTIGSVTAEPLAALGAALAQLGPLHEELLALVAEHAATPLDDPARCMEAQEKIGALGAAMGALDQALTFQVKPAVLAPLGHLNWHLMIQRNEAHLARQQEAQERQRLAELEAARAQRQDDREREERENAELAELRAKHSGTKFSPHGNGYGVPRAPEEHGTLGLAARR